MIQRNNDNDSPDIHVLTDVGCYSPEEEDIWGPAGLAAEIRRKRKDPPEKRQPGPARVLQNIVSTKELGLEGCNE